MVLVRCFLPLVFMTVRCFETSAQLTMDRGRALDSIVSSIPALKLHHLDSVHKYLHDRSETEEEQVWMFFGYLATYYKYDTERFGDFSAPAFSPHYTAQRRKGVCRDYVRVFAYLCDRSSIRNMVVSGKVRERWWKSARKMLHRVAIFPNHQWNIVFFSGSWHLMDPTWSAIDTVEKNRSWNPRLKQFQTHRIVRPSRTYYDSDPTFFAQSHLPIHPAFFLLDRVPSFKSGLRRKKKFEDAIVPFRVELDSLLNYEYPQLTGCFHQRTLEYSGVSSVAIEFFYLLSEKNWKTARYFKPTIAYYDERIDYLKRMVDYIRSHAGLDFSGFLPDFIQEMERKKQKLKRKKTPPVKGQK